MLFSRPSTYRLDWDDLQPNVACQQDQQNEDNLQSGSKRMDKSDLRSPNNTWICADGLLWHAVSGPLMNVAATFGGNESKRKARAIALAVGKCRFGPDRLAAANEKQQPGDGPQRH
jgi:hypothetical protein